MFLFNHFNRFAGYLKNKDPSFEEKLQHALIDELKKLNNYLSSESSPGKFLDGDVLKHPDCDILPKMQHVIIALRKYKKFEIPEELVALKKYMADAYEEAAFKDSLPTDEAIIEGWRKHF